MSRPSLNYATTTSLMICFVSWEKHHMLMIADATDNIFLSQLFAQFFSKRVSQQLSSFQVMYNFLLSHSKA